LVRLIASTMRAHNRAQACWNLPDESTSEPASEIEPIAAVAMKTSGMVMVRERA
jgi:hypothetical protein